MKNNLLLLTLLSLIFSPCLLWADDEVTISKPEAAPTEAAASVSQAPKPSQSEGEKAPEQSRPTAVPEFSLPEVVITGENELTIDASRLATKENDVTLGSHDLTGLDRAENDLPGLNKTMTALSTEEAGPSKDYALALHLGGGVPGTYGGWGLFGQEVKDIQYLVSGYYSKWGGQQTATGYDGDRKYGFNLETLISPASPLNLRLVGGYQQVEAELPYQKSIPEDHLGFNLGGTLDWKQSNLTLLQLKVDYENTNLNYWDQLQLSHQTQEMEGDLKYSQDDMGPVLNRFAMDAGIRHATSDLAFSSNYDWEWVGAQLVLKSGENLSLTAKLQAQGGNGLNLPWKVYPIADLMWRVFESSQLDVYWKNDRYVETFHNAFMDTEHISPEAGFPSPTELTNEIGGRFTQKLYERVLLSLSASTAQVGNYHQWTDIDPSNPEFIQYYSTVNQIQLKKAAANLQWGFARDWQIAGTYEWTQVDNIGGDGKSLTNLPTNKGILSLYRGDEVLETRLELQMVSSRNAYETGTAVLPAYNVLNLDATYHWTKTFSLWLNGDNLLGQAFELQPGYLEPQYHIRGGVEIIF